MIHVIVDTLPHWNFCINFHSVESVGYSYNCRERKKPSYYNDFKKYLYLNLLNHSFFGD